MNEVSLIGRRYTPRGGNFRAKESHISQMINEASGNSIDDTTNDIPELTAQQQNTSSRNKTIIETSDQQRKVRKPLISILIPSLNTAKYVRKCMDSVISQSLTNIEIICIDAGSTDGTYEILQEYALADPRIKLIQSEKKSYGHQMNLGLDAANGEFIGIVETDDWADADMYSRLYEAASKHNADVVLSNYFLYFSFPEEKNVFLEKLANCEYNSLTSGFSNNCALFQVPPSIWSGIYRRTFLAENHIRFNETPGASYQDASFHFMVCTAAKKIWLLRDAFLHYRQDNENSSWKSEDKVWCIFDEMHYYEDYVRHYTDAEKVIPRYMPFKFEKYVWNYNRIAQRHQWKFLVKMREEFLEHKKDGLLDSRFFPKRTWTLLQKLINEPICFYLMSCKGNRFFNSVRNFYFDWRTGKT